MRRSGALRVAVLAAALAAFLLALLYVLAQRPDPGETPYLTFLGGGFIFNYRVGEVSYGFTVQVTRPLPVGTVIEAEFEDPGGGAPFTVRTRVGTGTLRYSLTSPPVSGVVAGRPYQVTVQLISRDGKTSLARYEKSYVSQVGQEVLPDGPLTVGPGYHRAPPP